MVKIIMPSLFSGGYFDIYGGTERANIYLNTIWMPQNSQDLNIYVLSYLIQSYSGGDTAFYTNSTMGQGLVSDPKFIIRATRIA